MKSTLLGTSVALSFVSLSATHAGAAESALDYDYSRNRVEPIFLEKREGHARCELHSCETLLPVDSTQRRRRAEGAQTRLGSDFVPPS